MKTPVDAFFPPVETGQVPYWRLVLRGCSQLCFQTNELTGLFFLIAVLIASPLAAAYMLAAATLAPAGRMLLGDRGAVLETGLPGLNPCLIALSLPTFFHTGWTDVAMWGVLVVSVACTIVLTRLSVAFLPFPTLALPFLIIFWILFALAPKLGVLLPIAFGPAEYTAIQPLRAVLSSLGEAIFAPNIWSGLLFLVGVLLSDWRHGLLAFFGAVIGTVVSYYHREVVDPAGINLGLYGFNGVLTAVSVFVFCGGKLRLAILGAILATMLTPAISHFGVQVLSAPFVLTTWLMLGLGWVEQNWFVLPTALSSAAPASKPDLTSVTTQRHPGDLQMPALTGPTVLAGLIQRANQLRETCDWKPFRPGVTAHWLYDEGGGGAAAVLLRYEPGAQVSLHQHVGHEHMLVLEGEQSDEAGSYPAGTFIIYAPGTKHSPRSKGGCVALLIYEKAVDFLAPAQT
jgi:urea transporter